MLTGILIFLCVSVPFSALVYLMFTWRDDKQQQQVGKGFTIQVGKVLFSKGYYCYMVDEDGIPLDYTEASVATGSGDYSLDAVIHEALDLSELFPGACIASTGEIGAEILKAKRARVSSNRKEKEWLIF